MSREVLECLQDRSCFSSWWGFIISRRIAYALDISAGAMEEDTARMAPRASWRRSGYATVNGQISPAINDLAMRDKRHPDILPA